MPHMLIQSFITVTLRTNLISPYDLGHQVRVTRDVLSKSFCPNQWFLVLLRLIWFADESSHIYICNTASKSSSFITNSVYLPLILLILASVQTSAPGICTRHKTITICCHSLPFCCQLACHKGKLWLNWASGKSGNFPIVFRNTECHIKTNHLSFYEIDGLFSSRDCCCVFTIAHSAYCVP